MPNIDQIDYFGTRYTLKDSDAARVADVADLKSALSENGLYFIYNPGYIDANNSIVRPGDITKEVYTSKYELSEKNVLIAEALSDINKKWSHAFCLSLTVVYKFLHKKIYFRNEMIMKISLREEKKIYHLIHQQ